MLQGVKHQELWLEIEQTALSRQLSRDNGKVGPGKAEDDINPQQVRTEAMRIGKFALLSASLYIGRGWKEG